MACELQATARNSVSLWDTTIRREPRRSALAATRWTLAPLAWRDAGAPLGTRARTTLWRLGRVFRGRPSFGGPVAAIHPFTGDQLLTTNESEAGDMGYGEAVLIGYLDAVAPVTGHLGVRERPRLPWASRYGQRVR